MPLLLLQPFQFPLHACQSPAAERLQHLDELANIGMDLAQPPPDQFLFLAQPHRFIAKAGKRFLDDAVAGLYHPPDVTDAADQGIFQSLRRDAARLTGVFPALVLLPRADVVVAYFRATVGRRPYHMCPALASQQPREQVDTPFRLFEVLASCQRLTEFELHPVELLSRDKRLVTVLPDRIPPANLAEVDRVAQDADHLLLDEAVAAPLLVRTGAKQRIADAEVVQAFCDCPRRAEFLEPVEDAADDGRTLLVDLKLAGVIRPRAVAKDMATIPQTPVGSIPHDREGSLRRHLPFKLGEDHDELHHRLAGRHRSVELLPQGDNVHVMLSEQRPQVHEVLEASRNPVELEANDEIDLAGSDVAFQPLELRPVLVLGALSGIDVELQSCDIPVLAALTEFDFLLDFMLLSREAVTFRRLTLRGYPHVPGDPKCLVFVFLVWLAHRDHRSFR